MRVSPNSATVTSHTQLPPIPKPPIPTKPLPSPSSNLPLLARGVTRRCAALLPFLTLLSPSSPASAFSIGISGPKDWLKEQKRKSSKFLLAPIDASREILRSVFLLLKDSQSDYMEKEIEDVQKLLRSAARDCIPQERNSFVAFQARTGIEVCTFKLIVKNASSLLDKNDPAKLAAETMLEDLIRSFSSLNGLANVNNIQLVSNREKVAGALMDTIASLDRFEQSIKDCLEA